MMGIRMACLVVGAILVTVDAPLLWLWLPLCAPRHGPAPVAGGAAGQRPAAEGRAPAALNSASAPASSPRSRRRRPSPPRRSPGHRPGAVTRAGRRLVRADRPRLADRRRRPAHAGSPAPPARSAGSAPRTQAASRPAAKASPAPVVSTAAHRRGGQRHRRASRPARTAPAAPRLTTTAPGRRAPAPAPAPPGPARRPAPPPRRALTSSRSTSRTQLRKAAAPTAPQRRRGGRVDAGGETPLAGGGQRRAARPVARLGVQQRVRGQVQMPRVRRRGQRPRHVPRRSAAGSRPAR